MTDCLIRCRGKRCIQSQCCLEDDLFNEIIYNKSEKHVNVMNKKVMKKETVSTEVTDVDLTKFTSIECASTTSRVFDNSEKLKSTEIIDDRTSCSESEIFAINVDVNCISKNENDEMIGDETPVSVLGF